MTVGQIGDLCWALVWIVTFATPCLLILTLIVLYRRQKPPRSLFRRVVFGVIAVPICTYVMWVVMLMATVPLFNVLVAPIVQVHLEQEYGVTDANIVARGRMRAYWDDLWWIWTSADGRLVCGAWMYFFDEDSNRLPLECNRE
jgi:hypothetical protein